MRFSSASPLLNTEMSQSALLAHPGRSHLRAAATLRRWALCCISVCPAAAVRCSRLLVVAPPGALLLWNRGIRREARKPRRQRALVLTISASSLSRSR